MKKLCTDNGVGLHPLVASSQEDCGTKMSLLLQPEGSVAELFQIQMVKLFTLDFLSRNLLTLI